MIVVVNGAAREVTSGDVTGLVEELGVPAVTVLVEHNGLALRRDEWSRRALHDGDRIEIIRIVAGG